MAEGNAIPSVAWNQLPENAPGVVTRTRGTGLWLVLDTNSQDMKRGVMVLKFYFGSKQACVDAKAIFDGKNANLVAANPSGYMAHPLTLQDPHGGAMHNFEGRIRKETIPVPFFNMSKGPVCLLPRNSNVCVHIVSSNESIHKASAPQNAMFKHESYPHARFLRFMTPHNRSKCKDCGGHNLCEHQRQSWSTPRANPLPLLYQWTASGRTNIATTGHRLRHSARQPALTASQT